MGILAVVGLTSFNFSIQKARDSQRKSDLDLMAKGLAAWSNDFGSFPADDGSGLMVACDYGNTGTFSVCNWGKSMTAFINGGQQIYLSKIPVEPDGKYHYYYRKNGDGYALFSVLENTNDAHYQADAGTDFGAGMIQCGSGTACNYEITEAGVK